MLNRRSFFKRLLLGAGVFTILPPAETYGRIWRAFHPVVYPSEIECAEFTQFFVDQVPVFDEMILRDIRPTDGWIGHVETADIIGSEFWQELGQDSLDRFTVARPKLGLETWVKQG